MASSATFLTVISLVALVRLSFYFLRSSYLSSMPCHPLHHLRKLLSPSRLSSVPVLRPEDECNVSAHALPTMPFDNRASVSFSEECGARPEIPCPSCGSTYPQAGSFGEPA